MSKGSNRRPAAIPRDEYERRYAIVFGRQPPKGLRQLPMRWPVTIPRCPRAST